MSISAGWRSLAPTLENTETAAPASFQRDSLVWAFGKLAERAVRRFLRDAAARARYARWLAGDALPEDLSLDGRSLDDPQADETSSEGTYANPTAQQDSAGIEQGLLLVGLELGVDGCVRLEARSARGQFLLLAQHPRFHAIVALSHLTLSAKQPCDGICLADFEGDVEHATRWALGLDTWLSKRWSTRGDAPRPATLN